MVYASMNFYEVHRTEWQTFRLMGHDTSFLTFLLHRHRKARTWKESVNLVKAIALTISSEWYISTICATYLYLHTGICMTYYICRMVYVTYRVVYVIHMPRADLRFAALSQLPVAMKQSFSLRCDLLVNLLRITRGERLLCIIQLVTRTPAGGTLHCRTHSSMWHFVPVHWEKI